LLCRNRFKSLLLLIRLNLKCSRNFDKIKSVQDMTNITTPRSILSVGLNTERLCFFKQTPLSSSLGFSTLFELCIAPKNRSVSHIFCAARFREHCTLFTITRGNFTQNVMFILCCEFRLLLIRRETKTQLLFVPQFRHFRRHSDEIISFAGRKVNSYEATRKVIPATQ